MALLFFDCDAASVHRIRFAAAKGLECALGRLNGMHVR